MKHLLAIISILLAFVACKPSVPSEYVQPSDMEDILYEYHLARAIAQRENDYAERQFKQEAYLLDILNRHGVEKAQFDSSMIYYYNRSDRFIKIYRRVSERLDEKALTLGASESEINKYSSLSSNGDTTNVWTDRQRLFLIPNPPYNRHDFLIKADSTYFSDDEYLLQFMSDFIFQDGNRDGMVYVATEFADTVFVDYRRFSNTGITQMRIKHQSDKPLKAIKGYFMLGGLEPTTTLRHLFVSDIQLIRFHKHHADRPASQDSIPPLATP